MFLNVLTRQLMAGYNLARVQSEPWVSAAARVNILWDIFQYKQV